MTDTSATSPLAESAALVTSLKETLMTKTKTHSKRADNAPRKEVKMYDPHAVLIIGIDTDDGPSHWGYDEASNKAPVLEADVLFTYKYGIIQNVLAKRDGDKLVIVAGRGRTRQLREANKRRVADGLAPWFLPVSIVQGDARQMLALKLGENSHRREQSPLARAQQAYELKQQYPDDEAAVIMGLSVYQFRDILKLLDLGPAARKAIMTGDLKPTGGIELAALSEAEQEKQLTGLLAAGGGKAPTTRDVKAKIREASGKAPLATPSTRVKKVGEILDKLDENTNATKDDLWAAIKKIRNALK